MQGRRRPKPGSKPEHEYLSKRQMLAGHCSGISGICADDVVPARLADTQADVSTILVPSELIAMLLGHASPAAVRWVESWRYLAMATIGICCAGRRHRVTGVLRQAFCFVLGFRESRLETKSCAQKANLYTNRKYATENAAVCAAL